MGSSWGRQIAVSMSESAEHLFLQFLRSTTNIKILVSHAPKPELLCLEQLPPRKSKEMRFFLWNTEFPWTPDVNFTSDGRVYIRNLLTGPVIEYSRDGQHDGSRGRLFWSKSMTPGGSYSYQNPAYTYSYDAENFAKWYDQAVKWIKKNSKAVKVNDSFVVYRVNAPTPWYRFW